jgi:hypothetical protein
MEDGPPPGSLRSPSSPFQGEAREEAVEAAPPHNSGFRFIRVNLVSRHGLDGGRALTQICRMNLRLQKYNRVRLAMVVAVTVLAVTLAGPVLSSMYPQALDASSMPANDEAVALVGNAGPDTINYLQFGHSTIPAINAQNISLPPGGVIAIPIPVGTQSLSLEDFTLARRPGFYLLNGMGIGYIAVHTPKMDIVSRGLYYIATVFPGRPSGQNFETKPTAALLSKFKAERPKLAANLKAVNFSWPK